jgi:hypothetical protein
VQHFHADSGDYDDAAAQGGVAAPAARHGADSGADQRLAPGGESGSAGRKLAEGLPVRATGAAGGFSARPVCKPRLDTSMTWRNAELHAVMAELAPRVAGRRPQLSILPFENLTQPRWDMHDHVVRSSNRSVRPGGQAGARLAGSVGGKWITDCTHFCYSPRFWELSFHDLVVTLRGASGSSIRIPSEN